MKKGWEIKKLGEVCEVITKGTTPTSIGYKFTNEGINFIKVESLTDSGEIIPEKVAFISEECHQTLRRSQLQENDILFSIAGALGRIGIVDNDILPANTNQALAIVRLRKDATVLVGFLSKYFISEATKAQIEKYKGGVAQQNLSLGQLKDLNFPIPPITEQQRIVAILDEAFAAIDQAKENVQRNLQNAKELFQSELNSIFTNKGEGWEEKRLGEVCEISSKLIDPKEIQYQNLRHVGAGNIESQKGTLSNIMTAKEEGLISGKFLFDERMVLYSKIRPYLEKVVKCYFKGLCSADIYPLLPLKGILSQDFLYFLLLSKKFTDYAILGSQRAGMPKVNRDHLFNYKFQLPSFELQGEFIQKLSVVSDESQSLELLYLQKLKILDELKKSILQKAFSGDLTEAREIEYELERSIYFD